MNFELPRHFLEDFLFIPEFESQKEKQVKEFNPLLPTHIFSNGNYLEHLLVSQKQHCPRKKMKLTSSLQAPKSKSERAPQSENISFGTEDAA